MKSEKYSSKKKFVVLAMVFLVFISVGIGAAYLSKTLTVTGNGGVSSDFNVEIESVNVSTGETLGSALINEGKDTVTFDVTLTQPSDTYTAVVTVKNTGSIGAKYMGITPAGTNSTVDTNVILTFEANAVNVNDVLAVNGTHTFTFTFKWENLDAPQDALDTTYTFTYTINYQQAV